MQKRTILLCQEPIYLCSTDMQTMRGHNTEATMVAGYATGTHSSHAGLEYYLCHPKSVRFR